MSFVIYGCHMATEHITTAELIAQAMQTEDRSKKWTADRSGISDATFRRKLNGGADFTVGEVARVARALNRHPADLLPTEFRRVPEVLAA